jgi:hypothetical protein
VYQWEKGNLCDVRDDVGKWLEAEMLDLKRDEHNNPVQVFIHYCAFGICFCKLVLNETHFIFFFRVVESKWDEWIDIKAHPHRFAECHAFSAGLFVFGAFFPPQHLSIAWVLTISETKKKTKFTLGSEVEIWTLRKPDKVPCHWQLGVISMVDLFPRLGHLTPNLLLFEFFRYTEIKFK